MWGPGFASARKKYDEDGRNLLRCRCQCQCKKPWAKVIEGVQLCQRCAEDRAMFKDGALWFV